MKFRAFVLLTTAAIFLPYQAQAMRTTADAGFDYIRSNDSLDAQTGLYTGKAVNDFGGWGDVLMSFGHLDVQLGAGDQDASGGGGNAWSAKSDFFWRDPKGSFGLSVGRGTPGPQIATTGITSYGAFGEWYATRAVTLRFRGGAFNGTGSGHYGAISGEYYVTPDYGILLGYDYTSIPAGSLSTIDAGIDFQINPRSPFSIATGLSYTSVSGGGSIKTFGVALKFHFGTRGTLVQNDRAGPISWDGLLSL